MRAPAERRVWAAMNKFAADQPMTAHDWAALSWLTLINRKKLSFEPGNVRWATSEAERLENLTFYQSLGGPQ